MNQVENNGPSHALFHNFMQKRPLSLEEILGVRCGAAASVQERVGGVQAREVRGRAEERLFAIEHWRSAIV